MAAKARKVRVKINQPSVVNCQSEVEDQLKAPLKKLFDKVWSVYVSRRRIDYLVMEGDREFVLSYPTPIQFTMSTYKPYEVDLLNPTVREVGS